MRKIKLFYGDDERIVESLDSIANLFDDIEKKASEQLKEFRKRLSETPEKFIMDDLSVFDPFIATVYMRKGISKYNGLSKRNWMIFIMSLIIGNGIWAITVFTSLSLFQYVIKIFVHK